MVMELLLLLLLFGLAHCESGLGLATTMMRQWCECSVGCPGGDTAVTTTRRRLAHWCAAQAAVERGWENGHEREKNKKKKIAPTLSA
jgi:hypothetical protein